MGVPVHAGSLCWDNYRGTWRCQDEACNTVLSSYTLSSRTSQSKCV